MVKELVLFIFVLLILQEMSMSLFAPFWSDVMTTFTALVFTIFYLRNLNVTFLLIFNQTHIDHKPVCWEIFFYDMQVIQV